MLSIEAQLCTRRECKTFRPRRPSSVAIQCGNMSNAIVVHVHETEHPMDWDSARVIEREKHFACRKIKEYLHIKRFVNCINTDPGYYMHPVWFTTLHSMPR